MLKKITEAMKDLVTEANFDCSTTGISLQAMVRAARAPALPRAVARAARRATGQPSRARGQRRGGDGAGL